MSVTTSTNTITPSVLLRAVGDYEIHHSGAPGDPESRAPPPNPRPDLVEAVQTPDPPNWPSQYRSIPSHRPINYELDRAQRPGGMDFVEQMFIATLLNGCHINATIARIWRLTGGRVNSRIFQYKIGGEW